MGLTQTISVSLKDRVNQNGTISYSHERSFLAALADFFGFNATKVDDLKTLAETYSNAKAVSSGTTNKKQYSLPSGYIGSGVVDSGFDTCDQKAVMTFRDSSTGAPHRVTIPAPKSSMFEHVLGAGYRVIQSVGDTVASELSSIVGNTLIFEAGWLIGKK
jgi:hypothetical protein